MCITPPLSPHSSATKSAQLTITEEALGYRPLAINHWVTTSPLPVPTSHIRPA